MNADKIVSSEVYYNVSMLISELASDNEELFEVMVKDDYRTALEEQPDFLEILDWLDVTSEEEFNELEDYEIQEACDRFNIEPYQNEALEHWIVSDWLADKLEEHGEMVIRDFKGLTIWGRTTSGQHISMDYVIQKIAKD